MFFCIQIAKTAQIVSRISDSYFPLGENFVLKYNFYNIISKYNLKICYKFYETHICKKKNVCSEKIKKKLLVYLFNNNLQILKNISGFFKYFSLLVFIFV